MFRTFNTGLNGTPMPSFYDTILYPREAFPDRVASLFPVRPFVGGDFSLDDIEREHILRVTGRTSTLEEAAEILKIDTSTLWRKRKRYE